MATKNLDWFLKTLDDMKVDVDRSRFLEELQIATSSLHSSDLAAIVPHLPLNVVFDCFNTSEITQLEQTASILKKLLSGLNPVDIIKLYGASLGRALEHPNFRPRELVLSELNRAASNVDLLTIICKEIPLLVSVIECLKSDKLSLAATAAQFLTELGKIQPGIAILFSPPLIDHLRNVGAVSDIIKLRIYEVVVNTSVHSMDGLRAAIDSNILLELVNAVKGQDILVQLTSLEILTKLALTNHGLQFLKEAKFLHYVEEQINDRSEFNYLLLPGFIKFFGNIAQTRPREVFTEYPSVSNIVFELYESDDFVMSNVALETIGFVGSTPDGKLTLNEHDNRMRSVVQHLGKIITLQASERKVIALNVFTNIIQLNIIHQSPELLAITKKWFSLLSENPLKTIITVCEKPFYELKLAGLASLNAIAEQPWGQEEIFKCPGLIEYFLNRNEEGDMNCKAAKFKIVKTLSDSPFARNVFPAEVIGRFQLHVKQGIVYVQSKTEVAFESAA